MYGEILAAYLESGSLIKVAARAEGKFGAGDFSVTLLFSADRPGLLISCMEAGVGGGCCKGWYLSLREDASLFFYTSDGSELVSVRSYPIPECFDGYLYHLVAMRKNGCLKLYLEGDCIATSDASVAKRLDVSCESDLAFGGCGPKRIAETAYWGLLQGVTLWSRAIPPELFDFTASDILPHDKSGLRGWWPLDGTLTDRSPCVRAITFCEGVSYLPVFDMALAEDGSGYLYGNVGQTVPPVSENAPSRPVRRCMNGTTPIKLSRKITVPVDKPGAFFGTCCVRGPLLAYPKGVTLAITTPSGKKLRDMVSTEKQIVVLHEGSVYQFVFTEPEQGNWTLELTAEADSSFDLDYQFIPNGTTREQLTQTMNGLYPQFLGSTCADGITPTSFLFPSMAKIMTYDINLQLAQQDETDGCKMLGDPVVVGGVCVILGALALLCIGGWALCKGIQTIYRYIFPAPAPTPTPTPPTPNEDRYDWQTMMRSLHGFYEYSRLAWTVYTSIQNKFNGTVPTDPAEFYTRQELDTIPRPGNYLHLDIGGEGCFWDGNLLSGFKDAINLNVQRRNSQQTDLDIPFLIRLSSWESQWPFEDGSADRITSQGTPPYNSVELAEIARCLRAVAGARIDVWTHCDHWRSFGLEALATQIRAQVSDQGLGVRFIENAQDEEFKGHYVDSFAKYSVELY